MRRNAVPHAVMPAKWVCQLVDHDFSETPEEAGVFASRTLLDFQLTYSRPSGPKPAILMARRERRPCQVTRFGLGKDVLNSLRKNSVFNELTEKRFRKCIAF